MEYLDARFGVYLAVATLLIVTPRPDTALATRNALLAGKRAASLTTFGIGTGSLVWALASVCGLAVLLEQSVTAFTLLKVVGAAYLGYLGLRSVIACVRGNEQATMAPPVHTRHLGQRVAFRQELVSNLLNPKAGAIFATTLPQFIAPGDPVLRLVLMLFAYEAILLTWLHLCGYLVSRVRQSRFGTRVCTLLQGATGVILLALGIRLAFEHR
jgi:threonine/homoserine/homoserine lactone efflux protein